MDLICWNNKELQRVIEIESQREIKGKKRLEKRYDMSGLLDNSKNLLNIIRQHWGEE